MHFRQHIWHSRVKRPEAAATLVTSRQRTPMEEFNIVTRHSTELLLSVVFLLPSCALVFTRTLSISKYSRFPPHHRSITCHPQSRLQGSWWSRPCPWRRRSAEQREKAQGRVQRLYVGRESFSGGVCPKGGKRVQPDRHGFHCGSCGRHEVVFVVLLIGTGASLHFSSCGGAGQGRRHEKMSADRGVFGCPPPRGMRRCPRSCEEDRCAWHETLLGFCHHERMKARRRWDNPPPLPSRDFCGKSFPVSGSNKLREWGLRR